MKMLFLDDNRYPHMVTDVTKNVLYAKPGWSIAKSYKDFVSYVTLHGIPDIISFDQDLNNDDGKTGFDCALFLVEECRKQKRLIPKCLIHTTNIDGKKQMIELFHTANTELLTELVNTR